MDRTEACRISNNELSVIESAGYAIASGHIETAVLKKVTTAGGASYEVELSYHWKEQEHENILVICTVTSKSWFTYDRIEGSITLSTKPA